MDAILNEIHWAYLGDPKAISSLSVFVIAAIASSFVGYDSIVGKQMPKRWKWGMFAMSLSLASLSVFALLRFYDALVDIEYLMDNPEAVTTLSQRTWFLELPFLFVASALFVFVLLFSHALYQRKPVEPANVKR